jgi:hypothetical protein
LEILDQTSRIRERVAHILSPLGGRRVAIVAFIGRDVLDFIEDPKGLEVYCWPNPVATNPDGVRALLNAGATVYFVDKLHMKVYWSSKHGYLIGSPNLSANALDETIQGLREIGCYGNESTRFDVDAVIRRFKNAQRVDSAVLAAFERKYKPALVSSDHRTKGGRKAKLPSFSAYLKFANPKPFRLIGWGERVRVSRASLIAASEEYAEQTGREVKATPSIIADSISVPLNAQPKKWILGFRVLSTGKLGSLAWVYPHLVTRPKSNSIRKLAIQLRRVYVPDVPFDLSTGENIASLKSFISSRYEDLYNAEGAFNISSFQSFEAAERSKRNFSVCVRPGSALI